jgi:hypothetical protein
MLSPRKLYIHIFSGEQQTRSSAKFKTRLIGSDGSKFNLPNPAEGDIEFSTTDHLSNLGFLCYSPRITKLLPIVSQTKTGWKFPATLHGLANRDL